MPTENRSFDTPEFNPGPYLARVISSVDNKYMGALQVQLLRDVGNVPNSAASIYPVKYLSPFSGITGIEHLGSNNTYNDTQKSYGMWMVPPDPGTIVVVIFIDGNVKQGYWLGCVQDEYMNFMTPGLAATTLNTENGGKKPVAEYNKRLSDLTYTDTTLIKKPVHLLAEKLKLQGLLEDETRGTTTSSARRESPSSVFGISTPGPIDRRSGAPRGKIGHKESRVTDAFISRLGGTTFVMDDGDENYLRKKTAAEGAPEYASVENNESGGQPDIPHNELFRIRTRTGHQILLHNSEDLIYIGNSRGTAWIELTSDGKIDIFSEDSVSVHTKQDLNFYADRDINLESGRNINIKSKKETQFETGTDFNLLIGANGKILLGQTGPTPGTGDLDINAKGHIWQTSGTSNETKAGGNIIETAPKIHMNGPTAQTALIPKVLKTHSLPNQEGVELVQSIMRRLPTHEPWPHHENLDPLKYKAEKTDRDLDGRTEANSQSILEPPAIWTKTVKEKGFMIPDTFKKGK